MAMDILEFVFSDQAWAAASHLAVAGANGQPAYIWPDVANFRYWEMKGSKGFPWDGNSYDSNFLYQNVTDIDTALVPGGQTSWTDPSMFSMFASTSRTTGNGGIVWGPRQYNPSGVNLPIISDSTYRMYSACGTFTTKTLGGPVQVKWEGPYELGEVIPAFGPAINPGTPVLVQSYQWNPGFSVLEQNVYAGPYCGPSGYVGAFGKIQWQSFKLVNGVYALNQTSLFNTLVSGGTPALNFPCGMPTV
jgi:hypothetical protein